MSTNKTIIRNLSLALKILQGSVIKAVATERSVDSPTKVVTDHGIALDYLLAEQGGVSAMADTPCSALG